MKRTMDKNIKAPNAILKITSGAMLTSCWEYFFMNLITVAVLVSYYNT
jgi:hypothetical protein